MKVLLSKTLWITSLATGTVLSFMAPVNAVTFGSQFQTNVLFDETLDVASQPKGNVWLESVKIGTETIRDFSFISAVNIVSNDEFLGENTGAASADIGDLATTGIKSEDASASDILINLSNRNLNNIVDTEDVGSFIIDLSFGKAIDNLLIWERGMNSDLGIQALDNTGNLIGNRLIITRKMWFDAGFSINTTEIGRAQKVGSLGINVLQDLGVASGSISSLRFFSEAKFNGPDWKFVGTDASRTQSVPEPPLLLGLGLLATTFLVNRRLPAA